MTECPFCKEDIRSGAMICPHCQSSLLPPSVAAKAEDDAETGARTVYVVDQGLVKFAKFALAILGMFSVIGLFLYGVDLKETSKAADLARDEALVARSEAHKALEQIRVLQQDLGKTIEQARLSQEEISAMHRDVTDGVAVAEATLARVDAVWQEIAGYRERALAAVASLEEMEARALSEEERAAATEAKAERGLDDRPAKLWDIGATLRYGFHDGSPRNREILRQALERWTRHANVSFEEVDPGEAEIRVSFASGGGSWSYVGTDALGIPAGSATITLGLDMIRDEETALATALHETGHVLGLVHEFQNPAAGDLFDEAALQELYGGPPNNWDMETIRRNIVGPARDYPGSRPFDRTSVMNFDFPAELTTDGFPIIQGRTLSDSDKRYVAALYPPN